MRLFKIFIIFFSFLVFSSSYSQETKRLEFDERESNYKDFFVSSVNDNGFITYALNKSSKKGSNNLIAELYDSNFALKKSTSFKVDAKSFFTLSFYDDANKISYTTLIDAKDYISVIIYDVNADSFKQVEGKLSGKYGFQNMKVVNNKAYYQKGYKKSGFVIFDLNTGELTDVPLSIGKVSSKNIAVSTFEIFDDEIFLILTIDKEFVDSPSYALLLDLNGNKKDFFEIKNEKYLLTHSISKIDNKYIIAGSYAEKGTYSTGLYFAELENKKLNFIKYHDFLSLENFLNSFSEKGLEKLEKRKERKEKKNKDFELSYLYKAHPLTKESNEFELIGEFFYRRYIHTAETTRYIGCKYFLASITKFDSHGNVLWNNLLPMNLNRLPYYPITFIARSQTNNQINLAYADFTEIGSEVLNKSSGKILKEAAKEKLNTGNENEIVHDGYSDIIHWYDNNYLVYGNQSISNGRIIKRKIFFVEDFLISNYE